MFITRRQVSLHGVSLFNKTFHVNVSCIPVLIIRGKSQALLKSIVIFHLISIGPEFHPGSQGVCLLRMEHSKIEESCHFFPSVANNFLELIGLECCSWNSPGNVRVTGFCDISSWNSVSRGEAAPSGEQACVFSGSVFALCSPSNLSSFHLVSFQMGRTCKWCNVYPLPYKALQTGT